MGLPGPALDAAAGAVDDAGDHHAGAGEPDVRPDVLVHTERVNVGTPFGRTEAAACFGLDALPQGPHETPS